MARVTINKVNEAIRRLPGAEDAELVKGRDYFWFYGTEASGFYSQSVPVSHLNDLTVDQWVAEYVAAKNVKR